MPIARVRAIDDDFDLALSQSPRGERLRSLRQISFKRAAAVDLCRIYVLQTYCFIATFDRIAIDGNTGERRGNELL